MDKKKKAVEKTRELKARPRKLLTDANVPTYYSNTIDISTRGGPGWLDKMCSFLSGASRCSTYAAVRRVGRLSKYTPSGVWPSSA
jgi:hypothetical protein